MALKPVAQRLRTHAGRPVVSTLMTTALVQLLAAVTGILVARVLGPTGRGELAVVLLWPILLLTLGTLGVTDSITYHAARRIGGLRVLVSTSFGLAVIQGVALVALGLIVLPLILARYPSEVVSDCLLFLAIIPTELARLYMLSVLNGLHRFREFNLLRVAPVAIVAAGLIGLAIGGQLTVTTAVIAYLAAQFVTVAVGAAVVLRRADGLGWPSGSVARRILRYGWRSQLSTISNLPNVRLDQLAISLVLAPAALGLYVVAWNVTLITSLIGYSIAYAALPTVAAKTGADDRRLAARRYVSGTLLVTVPLAIPLLVFAPTILEAAFGNEFAGAAEVTRILLVASVLLGTGRVLGAVLKGANRPLDATIAEGAGLVVTLVGLATLLPLLDSVGAAITLVVAYGTTTVLALVRANRALGTQGLELLLPGVAPMARHPDSNPVIPHRR